MTVWCGSSAKRWNTIEMLWRRNSRSWRDDMARMSSSPTRTSPAEGSISRLMWRISVDLPEPDSPMTTWMPPPGMSMLMSFRPSTWLCSAISSVFDMPCLTISTMALSFGPKIL